MFFKTYSVTVAENRSVYPVNKSVAMPFLQQRTLKEVSDREET